MDTYSDRYEKITLHIGAHRTGSSSIQAALHIARADLAQSGLDIVAPQVADARHVTDHRPSLNRYLAAYDKQGQKSLAGRILSAPSLRKTRRAYLEQTSGQNKELLWSDENILGRAVEASAPGVLYPEVRGRLEALERLAGRNVDRVILTIRTYDEFLVSYEAMRQAYGDGGIGFDKLESWSTRNLQGWTSVVHAVQEVFVSASIEICFFSKFLVSERFNKLTGRKLSEEHVAEANDLVNIAPTKEALNALSSLKTSSALTKQGIDQLLLDHRNGHRFQSKEIFSSDFLDFLQSLYLEDTQEILRIPGLVTE
ncbi:hypothetical protein [Roseibium sp.]|uniref:hypothetical protein n=1 Tax=Roseibium sp. TaxID=1936156 RepID=UPI003B5074D0